MTFEQLKLIPPILKALRQENYEEPTPIQEQSIPAVLAGRDLLGCAQTGTGKTAAFALPIIQLLSGDMAGRPSQQQQRHRWIRTLILTPTRELAIQIADNITAYSRFTSIRCAVVVGGVSQRSQERELEQGTDILIATPGRLMDLMNQRLVDLQHIQILVLDEADRMLDMGFINDVKKIIAKMPAKRQTLFFSATMPPEIASLVQSILVNPVKVEITPVSSTVDRIEQSVYKVDKDNKLGLLNHLLQDRSITSTLVFTRTKHGADRVAKALTRANISAQAIHGDKSQNARQAALNNFKNGATRVLVATDIAARGIDIEELPYVINYNLPNIPETYVHRIGRTGRAGMSGTAISFCEAEELPYLKDIEKLIKKSIPEVKDHPFPMLHEQASQTGNAQGQGQRQGQRQQQGQQQTQVQRQQRGQGRVQGQGRGLEQGRMQEPGRVQAQGRGQGREQEQGRVQGQRQGREQGQEQRQGREQAQGQGQEQGRVQLQGREQGQGREQEQRQPQPSRQSHAAKLQQPKPQVQAERQPRPQSQPQSRPQIKQPATAVTSTSSAADATASKSNRRRRWFSPK